MTTDPSDREKAASDAETDTSNDLLASLARVGVSLPGGGTTYCIGECACGHELR